MKKTSESSVKLEKIAALCHAQWSGWMKYLFRKGTFNADGTWTMPKEFVDRWMRQAGTDYADLSGPEMDSDRTEAKKFIALFAQMTGDNA